jgi:hypothetical protein
MKEHEIWLNDIFREISECHFVAYITHPTWIVLGTNIDIRGEQPDAIRDRLTHVYGLIRYIGSISETK